jgi:hypothetical protein
MKGRSQLKNTLIGPYRMDTIGKQYAIKLPLPVNPDGRAGKTGVPEGRR